jgi:branched-chain amino acid transport system permease protein
MATLGISYLLDGVGQTIFGSDIYKIDIGMPKEPIFMAWRASSPAAS